MINLIKEGNKYDTYRVIEPRNALPQPAIKINNDMKIYDNEIRINAQTLNIDSASFTQIYNATGKDVEETKESTLKIVESHGKHQSPVTGSGEMLIGTVEEVGPALEGKTGLKVDNKTAILVSPSLVPLRIDKTIEIRPEIDQAGIKGKAILFESNIYAKIPNDLPENLILSVLDVVDAPAQTAKIAKSGETVAVIGGPGKAGILCLYEAKRRVGPTGKVICLNCDGTRFRETEGMGLVNVCLKADTTDAVGTLKKIEEITNGGLYDIAINRVSVENTEIASILSTKDDGFTYLFSVATSFTKATSGTRGVGKDVNMMIGNDYTKGHGEITLQIMRECKPLRGLYGKLST